MKFTSTKLCVLAQLMFLALVRATGTIHHSADDNFHSLSSLLSGDAEIYLPGSEGFVNGTASLVAKKPQLDALVKVATEQDVRNTYADAFNRPFLAISGGHGETWDLGNVRNGIGISMRGMVYVHISEDGSSATIGGGTQSGEVIAALWAKGKQAVTTACDCAGIIAPMLGGGHGWLQGQHGLLADNILSARVVLADGTAVTASPTVNSDLFWALRGAGHNFGVVTSVEYRIFDVEPGQGRLWAYEEYVFRQDKLEVLFEWANGLLQDDTGSPRPVELTHYGQFAFRPDVDSENPIIVFWLIWQGRGTVPPAHTDRVRAMLPISIKAGTTDITGMNAVAGAAYGTPACAKGSSSSMMFGVALKRWNIPGLRATLDIYSTLPPELRNGFVLLEAYSTRAVGAVPNDEAAYPDRFNQILISPAMYISLGNASLANLAADFGGRLRRASLNGSGQPLHAYVNYAHGDESPEALYGYEDWRLWRLRRLKAKFDPFLKFGYYAPIIRGPGGPAP
ncbi:hypothetical protein J7T55_003792 [Diaporthe amygdali]|uniref:uncharacterized protein n=1 Tax=Phomopsis amygdali TaxID=1214568 RepID=UPI0022FEF91D|nr:uncharacterized protein J7T55_003792 [Diaporthe amygdali]KAJ0117378.1 hypothetical protein J7T55_003792 [Diaporthe amygdali]